MSYSLSVKLSSKLLPSTASSQTNILLLEENPGVFTHCFCPSQRELIVSQLSISASPARSPSLQLRLPGALLPQDSGYYLAVFHVCGKQNGAPSLTTTGKAAVNRCNYGRALITHLCEREAHMIPNSFHHVGWRDGNLLTPIPS